MWQFIFCITHWLFHCWKKRRKIYEQENWRLLRRRRILIMRLLRQRRRRYVAKSCWAYPTTGRFWEETVPTFSDISFLKHFGTGRETFQCLVDELYLDLVRENTIMRRAIPVDKRIAVALTVLRSSGDFTSVAKLFGIGRSTVHLILKEFSSAICKTLYDKIVTFPETVIEREEIMNAFNNMWHFPGCLGALGASHIPILSPSQGGDDYWNEEGYHSIVLLGVADHQYTFRYADVGQPGGTSDSDIFFKSELYKHLCTKLIPEEFHLIAQSSFPLLHCLMTPFSFNKSKNSMQTKFDYHLHKALTPAEVAFSHLRGRWKVLLKRCDLQLDNMVDIVKTCLVLHNLCEINGDHYFDSWNESVNEETQFPQPLHQQNLINPSQAGIKKRNELAVILP